MKDYVLLDGNTNIGGFGWGSNETGDKLSILKSDVHKWNFRQNCCGICKVLFDDNSKE
jgi:hypothetical protein